jgi:chlorite dismutase
VLASLAKDFSTDNRSIDGALILVKQTNSLITIADTLSEVSLAIQALEQTTDLYGCGHIKTDLALWMIYKSIESLNESVVTMKQSISESN